MHLDTSWKFNLHTGTSWRAFFQNSSPPPPGPHDFPGKMSEFIRTGDVFPHKIFGSSQKIPVSKQALWGKWGFFLRPFSGAKVGVSRLRSAPFPVLGDFDPRLPCISVFPAISRQRAIYLLKTSLQKGRKRREKPAQPNEKSLRTLFGAVCCKLSSLFIKSNRRHAERVWANCLRKLWV